MEDPANPSPDLLRLSGITKSFGGVRALRGVDFSLRAGEIHALLGENGAGKSTLIKVIAGAHVPDAGTIDLAGRRIERNTPSLARELGIAVIYQQPALFADLSVAENLALRLERGGPWRRIRWRQRRRAALRLLARVGADLDPDADVRSLTMPQQQLVEIAAALGAQARVLILDEPTASLGERDAQNLFRVINELKQAGVGIIYISHRLEEVRQIADRVTVLRDGAYVTTRDARDISSADMIKLMVGRTLEQVFHKTPVPLGDVVLEVAGLSCRAAGVSGVNLTLRAGEILGLAGLVGAGRTELARVLFGITPADAGRIVLNGHVVSIENPADAVRLGIAYLPEDRRRHGVILDMPVADNTTLAVLDRISRATWINAAQERSMARSFVDRLGTKTPSIDTPVGNLSGGNQQKVALARWLATEPKVIILDEPTQGVDVGAKAEIHRLVGEFAARGMAVLMISSELPEVLGISDRIAVMRGGTIALTLDRAEATQERILHAALGHQESAA
ncbi:MAG: sugar ABC transporter ATP-binding protein [Tepidisphaeraceae bacterium]